MRTESRASKRTTIFSLNISSNQSFCRKLSRFKILLFSRKYFSKWSKDLSGGSRNARNQKATKDLSRILFDILKHPLEVLEATSILVLFHFNSDSLPYLCHYV